MARGRHERLRHRQVERDRAGELHVGAGGVEVRVVRDRLPRPAERAEQDLLRRPALVGGDQVLEREQLADGLPEAGPRGGPGVALVAALEAGPLLGGHGARAGVGEQVHEYARARHVEEVVARARELLLALLARRHRDRLHRVDAKRLDDRLKFVHSETLGRTLSQMAPTAVPPLVEAPPAPPERPGFFAVAWAAFLGYLVAAILGLVVLLASLAAGVALGNPPSSPGRGLFYRYDLWSWAAEACAAIIILAVTAGLVGWYLRERTGWEVGFGAIFLTLFVTGYAPALAVTPLYGATIAVAVPLMCANVLA